MLQPSRFLKEIPDYLRDIQAEVCVQDLQTKPQDIPKGSVYFTTNLPREKQPSDVDMEPNEFLNIGINSASDESTGPVDTCIGNIFLKRFTVEDRSVVSHLFHHWAKKRAFQNPKRLLDKVGFVVDERLRNKKNKHKDVLRSLKACLSCDEAFQYAEHILRWEQIPADERAHLMREKQEHFQKLRIENSMGNSAPTSKQVIIIDWMNKLDQYTGCDFLHMYNFSVKLLENENLVRWQIGYLQNLGCTVVPTSRLHASRLIEQYKSL
ncbi:hypothetical protein JCGZ_26320 [Jatropha curcas]|uniref:Uncharacterized protein n=1 Tax=Jatropha curcas TaxID=180498 RepID=A0A067JSG8_JATCU|nr:hypothetical protein JCGZ_26320 [Jatropha curcas]